MPHLADHVTSGSLEEAVEIAKIAFNTPAYARELGSIEISRERWTDLPLLSKEVLIEGVAPGAPYGDRLGVPAEEIAWCFVAPGPMFVPLTAGDIDALASRFAAAIRAGGFTSADVVDQTTLYNWVIAGSILGKALEKIGSTVVPGGAGDTQRHIDVIEQLGVTGILAFPTFLVHLLDTARDQGKKLPLQRAMVMGELHDPREKDRILREYGVSVCEFYGTGDVGPVAVECGLEPGMHLREDLFVELIDPQTGDPVATASPDRPAEIVVTDTARRAMPIIRMRTGDLIDEVTTAPCACGTATARIGRIVGRVGDITKVKGMFVVPGSIKGVLQRHGLALPYQLVVTRPGGRDELTLRVVGSEPEGWPAALEDVCQTLRVSCTAEFVEELEGEQLLIDLRQVV
ncbi:hypothetical protein ASC77_19695 [Nocardioides sp. Root1257]|uniref:phenylacetate--CoA ligase family protein n=1 Tax=unclassified Nocardioides TaxID=2615069 RepID=UPI0006F722CD|nr:MULTISPECIES: phenylacetate--CoA ligase family protein [unclassified Nocardioides]KQW45010.1 hypothetical protein ASC77_19695 [Nocardioides sp. Root1257]KRC45986.1 hypothetical protein ASE24_15525 [Nocardioides sp. Root224]